MENWIKVKKKLPSKGERVLAFDENLGAHICHRMNNNTWRNSDNEDYRVKAITHWMPLPEPPQI